MTEGESVTPPKRSLVNSTDEIVTIKREESEKRPLQFASSQSYKLDYLNSITLGIQSLTQIKANFTISWLLIHKNTKMGRKSNVSALNRGASPSIVSVLVEDQYVELTVSASIVTIWSLSSTIVLSLMRIKDVSVQSHTVWRTTASVFRGENFVGRNAIVPIVKIYTFDICTIHIQIIVNRLNHKLKKRDRKSNNIFNWICMKNLLLNLFRKSCRTVCTLFKRRYFIVKGAPPCSSSL